MRCEKKILKKKLSPDTYLSVLKLHDFAWCLCANELAHLFSSPDSEKLPKKIVCVC